VILWARNCVSFVEGMQGTALVGKSQSRQRKSRTAGVGALLVLHLRLCNDSTLCPKIDLANELVLYTIVETANSRAENQCQMER
jgi:hypothetical protein